MYDFVSLFDLFHVYFFVCLVNISVCVCETERRVIETVSRFVYDFACVNGEYVDYWYHV